MDGSSNGNIPKSTDKVDNNGAKKELTASDEEDKDDVRRNNSHGYPRIPLNRPGFQEKADLPFDIVDYTTKEGRQRYKRICQEIEDAVVERGKDDFLTNTNLYIELLKRERSVLEQRHNKKINESREEKRCLEEGVAVINEKILEARKRGEEQWTKYKAYVLRDPCKE